MSGRRGPHSPDQPTQNDSLMVALRPGPASPHARQQRIESPLQVARVAGAVVEIAHAVDLQVGLELS
eukprot:1260519-Alexandrium_andersonii.AAC.1